MFNQSTNLVFEEWAQCLLWDSLSQPVTGYCNWDKANVEAEIDLSHIEVSLNLPETNE